MDPGVYSTQCFESKPLIDQVGPKDGTFSAHPRRDPSTGTLYYFAKNSGPDSLPLLAFAAIHPNGTKDRCFSTPAPPPPSGTSTCRPPPPSPPSTTTCCSRSTTPSCPTCPSGTSHSPRGRRGGGWRKFTRSDVSRLAWGEGAVVWNSSYNLRFGVLPREAGGPGEMVWVECPR